MSLPSDLPDWLSDGDAGGGDLLDVLSAPLDVNTPAATPAAGSAGGLLDAASPRLQQLLGQPVCPEPQPGAAMFASSTAGQQAAAAAGATAAPAPDTARACLRAPAPASPADSEDRALQRLLGATTLPCSGAPAPHAPLSPPACVAAAVKLKRPHVVRLLLANGVPPNFRLGQIPAPCRATLEAAGISLAGCEHMSPLVMAVRQLSADIAGMLLQSGAALRLDPPAAGAAADQPLLLQFLDAVAAEAAAAAAAACQAPSAGGSGGASGSPSTSSGSVDAAASAAAAGAASMLEAACRMLETLLLFGADPLEPDGAQPGEQAVTFLSECNHPVLLRMAVTSVQQQCTYGGRRLSVEQCQQLLSAGRRAYATE